MKYQPHENSMCTECYKRFLLLVSVCGSGVHVLTAPLSVSCQRLHTTTTTTAPDVPVNDGNVFKRFWRWLNQGVTPEEVRR